MIKKQVKSYTLSEEAIQSIEAYSAHSGNSLSQSAETLILRGLENTFLAEQLADRVNLTMKKIVDTNNKSIDRLIAILIGQTRTIGKLYGIIVTESVRRGIINQNELDQVFGSGIKKAMADLKVGEVGEKDYE